MEDKERRVQMIATHLSIEQNRSECSQSNYEDTEFTVPAATFSIPRRYNGPNGSNVDLAEIRGLHRHLRKQLLVSPDAVHLEALFGIPADRKVSRGVNLKIRKVRTYR